MIENHACFVSTKRITQLQSPILTFILIQWYSFYLLTMRLSLKSEYVISVAAWFQLTDKK